MNHFGVISESNICFFHSKDTEVAASLAAPGLASASISNMATISFLATVQCNKLVEKGLAQGLTVVPLGFFWASMGRQVTAPPAFSGHGLMI